MAEPAERRVWLAPLGVAAGRPGAAPVAPLSQDRGLAQVAVAGALALEGLAPVGAPPAEVALWLAPPRGPEAAAVRPRVGLVPELEPTPTWRGAAERYAVVDEGAAASLIAIGVPVERVAVTGWPLAAPWHEAAQVGVDEARRRFGLGEGLVAAVDTRGLDAAALGALLVQLSLIEDVALLFDAPHEATVALLRERCPPLGLRARRFGATPEAALLWRTAEVLVGRPRPGLVAVARRFGAALLALPAFDEDAEAAAVGARGLGRPAPSIASVAATFERLRVPEVLAAARGAALASARPDAAVAVARLLSDVLRRREAILAEPAPSPFAEPTGPAAPEGPLEEVGVTPEEEVRLHADRRFARHDAEAAEAAASRDLDERLAALKARVQAAPPAPPPGDDPDGDGER